MKPSEGPKPFPPPDKREDWIFEVLVIAGLIVALLMLLSKAHL